MANWFVEYRLTWIKESIEIFGFINREHIEKKFGISAQHASSDLAELQRRWPGLIKYNTSNKQYLRGDELPSDRPPPPRR